MSDKHDRTVGEWLRDIEARVRRLEYAQWVLVGVVATIQFLRACN